MDEQQYNNFNGNSNETQTLYGNQVPSQQPYQAYAQNNASQTIQMSAKYKPIKAWGYFGYSLLFAIPLVGLIFNLVFCFSDKNINRRNFARSVWCGALIAIAVGIVLGVLMAVLGLSADDLFQQAYYI